MSDEGRRICRTCGAGCCQGPLVLTLTATEAERMAALARDLGIAARIRPAADGARLRFPDHPGSRCPMLDPDGWSCRIYDERPERCRRFPEQQVPGCALSGG